MIYVLRISIAAAFLAGVGALLIPRTVLRATIEKLGVLWRWLDAPTPRNRATAFAVIWIVALLPMLYLTYLVRHYAVEVPTLDDWEMAPLIVQARTGHFPWAEIFAQQQEARTVLPKLIFILSAAAGHWDVRDQMLLSVICCWLTAAGIFVLLRRSELWAGAIAICFWLAVLAIFTPAKFELWIFASGFPSFFPALFLVAALVVIGTERIATAWKFILCATVATASSFSLPNGLLAWGLTFPILLLAESIPRRRSWLLAWIATTAVCAVIYFWGYEKPADLTAFAPAVSWKEYAGFILEFLGGSLAYAWKDRPGLAALVFGLVQLTIFGAAIVYCVRRVRDRVFISQTLPWFALALHSIGSAVLAALGRVGYGASYALASRYVTFSIYLTIAIIGLIALIVRDRDERGCIFPSRKWSRALGLVLVVAYLIPYKVCASNCHFFMRALSAKDRLARAAVLFCQAIDTSEIIKKTAYPNDARPVMQGADGLDRLNLIRPRLVRTNRLETLPHDIADGRRASGSCESITTVEGNSLRATGWAALDAKRRPADCVALAYRTAADQSWTLFAISDSFAMRPDIVKRFHLMDQLWSAWSATFPRTAVPAGAELSFWAVDADEPRLYQLKDESGGTARTR
jgi:hypothetical protein